jgi:SAM-dependent methyltransferase
LKPSEYTNIRLLEDFHWWYVATHRAVFSELKRLSVNTRVLDAGCGTGGLLEFLRKSFNVAGFDDSFEAVRKAFERNGSYESLAVGDVESIPFHNNRFNAVTCIDVIYHANVADERVALNEMNRVLKPGGYLILQVPAFECLRGGHDEAVHTRKRYRAREIRSLLIETGFKVTRIRYRYPWLFLLALIIRKVTRGSGRSDLRPVNPVLNALLSYVSRFSDSSIFPRLPFGTSVFAVGQKIS